MIGVVNASPLIYLGKLGTLELLRHLFTEIWTSTEVKAEVLTPGDAPEVPLLENAFTQWLKQYPIEESDFLHKLTELNIHRGEATVIAIACKLQGLKKEQVVIIDDLTSREVARTFSIPVIGTVGILLRGVKMKFLTRKKGKSSLDFLFQETEFRITTKLYIQIIKILEDL